MSPVLLIAIIVIALLVLWQVTARIGRRYIKSPAPAFIASFLDSGFRKSTQPPRKIAAYSGIEEGMQVLEEENSLDLVFMVTVLQEIPHKQRVLNEIKRVLKPGGILAVSEYIVDPDYPWESTTRHMVARAGFIFDASFGNIGSYTVRFRKP